MSDLRSATSSREVFAEATTDPYTLAVRAYVWGFPLVAMAWIRIRATNPDNPFAPRPASTTGSALNRWGHQRVPSDPSFRAGVGPSVDLLYSSLRLDLAEGPFVVETPDFGDRYYTIQIAHADSSAELSYGRRTHGGQLPALFLAGPGDSTPAPAGVLEVRSHTRYLLMPGRMLFDPADPADLARIHLLQDRFRVRTLDAYVAGDGAEPPVPDQRRLEGPDPAGGLEFLHQLGNVLRDWVVQPEDRGIVAQLASIGLTPATGFDAGSLDDGARTEAERGLRDGMEVVRRKSLQLGRSVNGWTVNLLGPRFGDDWLLRAGVAKDQIVVTVPEEAIYPIARVDREGRPLDGSMSYRIRLSAEDLPPVGAFWSITLYGDDGFLIDNPLHRSAISERTPGVVRRPDGGMDIEVSAAPADTNWLPAPLGPFYLMMRLYLPGTAAIDGRWRPPAIERLTR